MSINASKTEVRFDTDELAEIVADHYRSYNIELDTKNYVWNGEHLKLKIIVEDKDGRSN